MSYKSVNYYTYSSEAKPSYNFERLMCYYLAKRALWKRTKIEDDSIAHWSYNQEDSLVKRYPYYSPFTRKDYFYLHLSNDPEGASLLPETYLLQNGVWYPKPPINIRQRNTVWYCKHPYRDGSRGIEVSRQLATFVQQSIDKPTYNFVIQPTIPRPWLDKGKYKCDIRMWGVITYGRYGLGFHLYRYGTLRVNPEYYREQSDLLECQLTNSSFFKKKQNLDSLIREFNSYEPLYQKCFRKIVSQFKIFWKIYKKILAKKKHDSYCLELFGFDFLCNQEGRTFFIECNRKPNYHLFKRYQTCVETLIPTLLEPLLKNKPFPAHPLWIHF